MANSDTHNASLYFAPEDAWGETPDLGSELQEINFLSDNLDPGKITAASESIQSHRGVSQMPVVGFDPRGSIVREMNMIDVTAFLSGALRSSGSTSVSESVTVNVSGQTMTLTSGSFSANTQKCRYVRIANAATAGNNGIKKVSSWASGSVTFVAGSLSGSDSADAINITGSFVQNGSTTTSYLFERKYGNLASAHYLAWTGITIDSMSLALASRAKVMSTLNLVGESAVSSTTTSGNGSPLAKSNASIFTTSANVGTIYENGTAISIPLISLNPTISQGTRTRPFIGSNYSLEHGLGDFGFTGQMRGYFTDKTLLDRFLLHSDSVLEFYLTDGSSIVNFYAPKIKLNTGNAPIEGRSRDIFQTLDFYALPDSTGRILQVDIVS